MPNFNQTSQGFQGQGQGSFGKFGPKSGGMSMAPQPNQSQNPQPQLPPVPPELLMTLLSHLASGTAQAGAPLPRDGGQMPPLNDLVAGLLQALAGPQNMQNVNPQQLQQGQQPQQVQPQQVQQASVHPPQTNPIAMILQSLGLRLG